MREPLAVEVTALATRQIREAESWWRINRTAAPHAVREELQRVFALIALQPMIIKYHLYYHVVAGPERVQVVALWHARRGKGPPI